MDGSPLRYPGEAAVPDGFSVFMDWLFVVEPSYSGDILFRMFVCCNIIAFVAMFFIL